MSSNFTKKFIMLPNLKKLMMSINKVIINMSIITNLARSEKSSYMKFGTKPPIKKNLLSKNNSYGK